MPVGRSPVVAGPLYWQDMCLTAILNADASALGAVLDRAPAHAIRCTLQRSVLSGTPCYLLGAVLGYRLQWKAVRRANGDPISDAEGKWKTSAAPLRNRQTVKGGLKPATWYVFRLRTSTTTSTAAGIDVHEIWGPPSKPYCTRRADGEHLNAAPPPDVPNEEAPPPAPGSAAAAAAAAVVDTGLVLVKPRCTDSAPDSISIDLSEGVEHALLGHEVLYSTDPEEMRHSLGSSYAYELEEGRAAIARWLDMIGAKTGDTLMHVVLRLNGVDELTKARCAVELLGRGASFEVANCEGELPAMVDPAFKLALFHELPAWKTRQAQDQRDREREANARRRAELAQQRTQQRRMAEEQLVAQRQEEKRMARAAVKEAHERARFHRDINKTLERLDVREQRRAKENPAWAEFWTEVRSIPGQVERWLAKK